MFHSGLSCDLNHADVKQYVAGAVDAVFIFDGFEVVLNGAMRDA